MLRGKYCHHQISVDISSTRDILVITAPVQQRALHYQVASRATS